jgi:hypothetical protein
MNSDMEQARLLKVQYGAGFSAPAGWLNYDASMSLRLERLPLVGRLLSVNQDRFPASTLIGDIVEGLDVPDGSCSAVYASHVIEHLTLEDARTAFRNTLKLLAPGGTFRMVVPDLKALADRYVGSESPEAAHTFMRQTLLGREARARGIPGFLRSILGKSAHLWMWDYPALQQELARAGFTDIRRCAFNDCADRAFAEVEDPIRFEDAVAVEGRRPV